MKNPPFQDDNAIEDDSLNMTSSSDDEDYSIDERQDISSGEEQIDETEDDNSFVEALVEIKNKFDEVLSTPGITDPVL